MITDQVRPAMPRRLFLQAGALAAGSFLLARPMPAQTPPASSPPRRPPPPKPPTLPPQDVQATVGHAHRSLDEVKKLVDATPLLANACWDWGGGDFETPLEAAAHTGRREIAEYLLARGARPSLFAAAMLGQLELVQAFLAIDPKAHLIPGPHGFTLMHCANTGGDRAKPVVDWLLARGVSEERQRELPYIWPEGAKPAGS
ncbi:MAG TPA: hypothetical protein VEB66_02125 [Opitutaceae bacterium]|nr:hypothetical protein [Opitutaceae bacterium]